MRCLPIERPCVIGLTESGAIPAIAPLLEQLEIFLLNGFGVQQILVWTKTPDTNSINDCNTSLGEDAMNRVSTNGLFVAFFF